MVADPWDFDYRLEPAAVAEVARVCGFAGVIRYLDEGWDYATYLCDGHILRIPKRAESASILGAEHRLLRSLPTGLSLQTPRPLRRGKAGCP